MLTPDRFDHPLPNAPRLLLPDHHCKIEAACEALRACTYADEPHDLVVRYRSFEREVLEHLKAEEDSILPEYEKYAPVDAAMVSAAHDDLRRQLFRIGVDVELHCVRAEALEHLVQTLRSHAAHEDRGMYPWAETHLPPQTLRELFDRIAHSLRALWLDDERGASPVVNE
jgi:hypothetical protein